MRGSNRWILSRLRENLPAPGVPIQASPGNLYVRMRNRGLGAGDVNVQLFASPAATLITPERWIPVGTIAESQIPQGDTLSVAGPIPWSPGPANSQSLLELPRDPFDARRGSVRAA